MRLKITLQKIFLSIILISSAATVSGGDGIHGWFGYAPYGHSLYADEHPDFFRLDVTAFSNRQEYNYGSNLSPYRVQTLGVFGIRLPVWHGNLGDGRYGLSVTQSMSANIWMDLFETSTSPVVNTDYRIAVPAVTFIHRFENATRAKSASDAAEPPNDAHAVLNDTADNGERLKANGGYRETKAEKRSVGGGFLKNYSIQLCPFKHESTHIGDEMVLQRADNGYALRRVNVSYNYCELDFTLNEPEDRYLMTHTFRIGLMVLLNPREGWYFVEERDGEVNNIPSNQTAHVGRSGTTARNGASGLPFEMFLQYQFQSPCSKHGFQGIASAEVRNRAVYGYDLTEKSASSAPRYASADPHRFTYNIFIGARYNTPRYDGYFSRFAAGIRAYHGNCPYGMFRSIDNVSHIGVCLIFQ